MLNLLEFFAGPLAPVECRRVLGRGWVPWVRSAAAVLLGGALIVTVWTWWLCALFLPNYRPTAALEVGLAAAIGLAVGVALLLTPAMLAGALAGERDRGTLALLLTTRVTPREIVAGRLSGRVAAVALALLAGVPAVAALAGLLGLSGWITALALALPLAVAVGGGGLALAASVVARRGREALMAVYLVDLVLVLGPALGRPFVPPVVWTAVAALNPFGALGPLVIDRDAGPALRTVAVWTALGLAGVAWAGWRMVPIYLRQMEGERPRRGRRRSFRWLSIADRPMLWKELHTEAAGRRGWVVRGLSWLLMAVMFGSSAALATVTLLANRLPPELRGADLDADLDAPQIAAPVADEAASLDSLATEELGANGENATDPLDTSLEESWSQVQPTHPLVLWQQRLGKWLNYSALPLGWLLQWAIALRASVAIVAEREASTWDTLLTTPLEPAEIIWSKIGGSLYALRGLLAVAAISWTVAWLCGGFSTDEFWSLIATTLVVGAFMAAVGVWASLSASSATWAMTIALGVWLGAVIVIGAMTLFLIALGSLLLTIVWMWGVGLGVADMTGSGPFAYFSFGAVWTTIRLALYALGAILVGWYCRRYFDLLAGRVALRIWPPRRMAWLPAPPLQHIPPPLPRQGG
jgi:ABC-type transport system involved in multi-copper enzyme maturation permease subunit